MLSYKHSNIIIEKSKPIDIPKKNKNLDSKFYDDFNKNIEINKKNNDNYKLDINQFDPSKFSPPNTWALRLKTRLKEYNSSVNKDVYKLFISE